MVSSGAELVNAFRQRPADSAGGRHDRERILTPSAAGELLTIMELRPGSRIPGDHAENARDAPYRCAICA
jgi:hypothetical protein